jgi:hypothetical protein
LIGVIKKPTFLRPHPRDQSPFYQKINLKRNVPHEGGQVIANFRKRLCFMQLHFGEFCSTTQDENRRWIGVYGNGESY